MPQTGRCKLGAVSLRLQIHPGAGEGPGPEHGSDPSTVEVTTHRPCPSVSHPGVPSTTAACTANANVQAGSGDPAACEDATATGRLPESPAPGHLEFGSFDQAAVAAETARKGKR